MYIYLYYIMLYTWWLIPLSKWVITPVIKGISRVSPLITGVNTHLLSGMSHQVYIYIIIIYIYIIMYIYIYIFYYVYIYIIMCIYIYSIYI